MSDNTDERVIMYATLNEYHKIDTIFKRDQKGNLLTGQYSCPEFEYLKDNLWFFTEKVDGTNVRVMWDGAALRFGGKTDNAQMPVVLMEKLQQLFSAERMAEVFVKQQPDEILEVCLYGEGYGAKIQKGGGNYIPNNVNFVLFDVKAGRWWLTREAIDEIAEKLTLRVVPTIGSGTLADAVKMAQDGFTSRWGDFLAEGIVLRPSVELFGRAGQRIITKIKHRDFK